MRRPWPVAQRAAAHLWIRVAVLRFAVVGLLNTGFGYVAFLACLALGLPVPAALVLSTGAGVAFNFQTSRRLVFRSRDRGLMPRFVAVYALLTGLDWIALRWLEARGVPAWSAQGGLVLPLAALSFAAQRRFVFQAVGGR